MIRVASTSDAPALASLINAAFQVEAFFKIGDRTSTEEVLELMRDGEFLVLEDAEGLAGCVYLTINKDGRAYFGMLSIDPSRQGRGFGRRLVDAAEARGRERGCRHMDIHIVNLREELPPFYRKFGYVEQGTLPFPSMERASRPCHFIVMTKLLAALALVISLAPPAAAQQTLRAIRTTDPPVIDGRLSEDAWSHADVADRFTQKDPDEGKPATEKTEIRIMYDADALYVGARMHDSEAAKIGRRLASRDEWDSDADRLMIFLDPRHDRRTGVELFISAAGVQRDAVISNDTFEDTSWDAVWASAVTIDSQGWSAELRIPYSQLRFNAADSQIWGLNVARFIRRRNETSWLELVPKNENGLASRMIPLTGLDGIRSGRHLELAPYTAMRQERVQPDKSGDPFNDGTRAFGSIGLDVKARVSGGLTLDATINPDFGQAEVDPAVVNLSAFETFFQEKRRFFIEGSDIFSNFGLGGANNFFGFNMSDPDIFYSRRIGRAPQGHADGDFVDVPRAMTITAAAKLTGKTANGWTIGVLEALT